MSSKAGKASFKLVKTLNHHQRLSTTARRSNAAAGSATSHHAHLHPPHHPGSSTGEPGPSSSSSKLPSFWVQPASSASYPPPPPPGLSAASILFNPTASVSGFTNQQNSANTGDPSARFRPKSLRQPDRSSHQSNNRLSHNHLVLHHGAYGIPKRPRSTKGKEKAVPPSTAAETGDADGLLDLQQQPLLSVQVGEDAYFVRHDALGVADGVGGWAGRKGADPGLFAARLMHHCSSELALYDRLLSPTSPSKLSFVSSSSTGTPPLNGTEPANKSDSTSSTTLQNPDGTHASGSHAPQPTYQDHPDSPSSASSKEGGTKLAAVEADPIEVLHTAWDSTLTEFFELELIGSSTALIAMLKEDELRVANLGDCCCSIIRGKEYIFRSQEQQHSFNYPYQVGTNSQDTPRKDGQRFTIKVQKDDIVILSSDGLVDNLFDEDILEEVERYEGNPQELSQALCSRAKAVSEDQRAVTSPFQQRANEEGIHFVGGKHDDISVLVAVIGDGDSRESSLET